METADDAHEMLCDVTETDLNIPELYTRHRCGAVTNSLTTSGAGNGSETGGRRWATYITKTLPFYFG